MTFFEKLFTNLFDDRKITSVRLYDFGMRTLNAFIENNEGGIFDDIITLLTASLATFNDEISGVDTNLNKQVGKTQTNDEVMEEFIKTMSAKEGVIADKLGGSDKAEFKEFYPHGQSEYSNASKAKMPTLTKRVFDAAATYATELGTDLKNLLQSYVALWKDSRDNQTRQFSKVEDFRSDRNAARNAVEMNLISSIGLVLNLYPASKDEADKFFDFTMLYAKKPVNPNIASGTIPPNGTVMVFNRMFTASHRILTKNTDDNASLMAALLKFETDAMTTGITVEATKEVNQPAADYGDLAFTFLMLKNLSDINEVSYTVEIIEE